MDGILTGFSGMMRGRAISVTDATHITGTIAQVALATASGLTIVRQGVSFSINTATVGAGGRSTATAIQASTEYFMHVIDNGTAPSCLLDTSATAPTLPSGYSYFYCVGSLFTSTGTSGLIAMTFMGKRVKYRVGGANCANLPIILTGATGSYTTPTFTAISLVSTVSSLAMSAGFTARVSNGLMAVCPNNSYGVYNSATNPPYFYTNNANTDGAAFEMLLESTNAYVYSQAGSLLAVNGWVDDL